MRSSRSWPASTSWPGQTRTGSRCRPRRLPPSRLRSPWLDRSAIGAPRRRRPLAGELLLQGQRWRVRATGLVGGRPLRKGVPRGGQGSGATKWPSALATEATGSPRLEERATEPRTDRHAPIATTPPSPGPIVTPRSPQRHRARDWMPAPRSHAQRRGPDRHGHIVTPRSPQSHRARDRMPRPDRHNATDREPRVKESACGGPHAVHRAPLIPLASC